MIASCWESYGSLSSIKKVTKTTRRSKRVFQRKPERIPEKRAKKRGEIVPGRFFTEHSERQGVRKGVRERERERYDSPVVTDFVHVLD